MTAPDGSWHADGTFCGHGWPAGAEPRAAVPAGRAEPLPRCAAGRQLTWYRVTITGDPGDPPRDVFTLHLPPGWACAGTDTAGHPLYTAPPGTPWPWEEGT